MRRTASSALVPKCGDGPETALLQEKGLRRRRSRPPSEYAPCFARSRVYMWSSPDPHLWFRGFVVIGCGFVGFPTCTQGGCMATKEGTVHVGGRIPADLARKFKLALLEQGQTMQEVMERLAESYVKRHA